LQQFFMFPEADGIMLISRSGVVMAGRLNADLGPLQTGLPLIP
jgi:hypothetical protein